MSNELVKLPKTVAEAIDGVINNADENILYDITYIKNVCEGDKWDAPKLMPIYNYIQNVGLKEYFKALVVGYKVEETPEDKVKAFYELLNPHENRTVFNTLEVQGIIEKVLNLLNIKIEGVNS